MNTQKNVNLIALEKKVKQAIDNYNQAKFVVCEIFLSHDITTYTSNQLQKSIIRTAEIDAKQVRSFIKQKRIEGSKIKTVSNNFHIINFDKPIVTICKKIN